jgi:hypothetical protein
MANTDRPDDKTPAPAQDEWGLYDPDKAGLSALFNRLDVLPATETEPESGPRTRILNMSGVRKPAPKSTTPGGRTIL